MSIQVSSNPKTKRPTKLFKILSKGINHQENAQEKCTALDMADVCLEQSLPILSSHKDSEYRSLVEDLQDDIEKQKVND